MTLSAQRILSQGYFTADSANLGITLPVDTLITVDYLTAIVRSADQLDYFACHASSHVERNQFT